MVTDPGYQSLNTRAVSGIYFCWPGRAIRVKAKIVPAYYDLDTGVVDFLQTI